MKTGTRLLIAECLVDYLPAQALKSDREFGYAPNLSYAYLNFKLQGVMEGQIKIHRPNYMTLHWSNSRNRRYPREGTLEFTGADTMLRYINDVWG